METPRSLPFVLACTKTNWGRHARPCMHRLFSFWDRMTQFASMIVRLEGLVTFLTVKSFHMKNRIIPLPSSHRNFSIALRTPNQNQTSTTRIKQYLDNIFVCILDKTGTCIISPCLQEILVSRYFSKFPG